MPTVVTNGGSARTIGATCAGVTKRGVFSTKMKPSASAPASTAVFASSRLVMPQIFTRVIVEWVGRDAPPIFPPARVATAHWVLHAPRCAPGGAALRQRVRHAALRQRVRHALRCAPRGAALRQRVLHALRCAPGGAALGCRVLPGLRCASAGAAPGCRILLMP